VAVVAVGLLPWPFFKGSSARTSRALGLQRSETVSIAWIDVPMTFIASRVRRCVCFDSLDAFDALRLA